VEIPWRADVFRGAPQDKSSKDFGTLGINLRARKLREGEVAQPIVCAIPVAAAAAP